MKKSLFVLLLTSANLFAQYSEPAEKKISTEPSKKEIKQSRISNAPLKSKVWSLEIATLRYWNKMELDHSMYGTGGRISIGYGAITETRLYLADVSLYFGPFGENYHTVSYDYSGSGAALTVGQGFNSLRADRLGFGILGGISYQDFYGRYYGRNDADAPVPATSDGIVTIYGNTTSSADVNFGFFLSSLRSQRPDTHDAESLTTRNEGVIWSLQASLPVWSRFRARYKVQNAARVEQDRTETGKLKGFKVFLSLRAFLGT